MQFIDLQAQQQKIRPQIDAAIKRVFKADHPFIFLIKENSRNGILFMGRVENP